MRSATSNVSTGVMSTWRSSGLGVKVRGDMVVGGGQREEGGGGGGRRGAVANLTHKAGVARGWRRTVA